MAQKYEKNTFTLPEEMLGLRLDKALASCCQGYSRSAIQAWLKQGLILVDGETPKQKEKVIGGEYIEIAQPQENSVESEPQDIALEIVHSDQDVLVINKPAGLVVHPGAGNRDGTLLNGLLYHFPLNAQLPRAGIVHRLDKDTSGLMVVAKNERARLHLVEQLVDHSLYREYMALVAGRVISGASVDEAIARDVKDRRKMAINPAGKEAITHFRIEERFRNHTLLKVQLETGRTHQIRVHMTHLGFPLVGDPVYGRRLAIPADCSESLEYNLRRFQQQALHARRIEFMHPSSNEAVSFTAELPSDMQTLLQACRSDNER